MYKKRDSVGHEMTEIYHSSNVWWIIIGKKTHKTYTQIYMHAGATNGVECMYMCT